MSYAPTKEQANKKGEILWYANGHGWYISKWNYGYMPQTTHWTYMPEDLNIPSEAELLKQAAFETWASSRQGMLSDKENVLLRIAFHAGWERGPA
jgi:hypothetical protein